MIAVRISVGPSPIHGYGCIAEEEILPGQLVWQFQEGFDIALKKDFVDALPAGAKENFLKYAYISKTTGDFILCSDDSKFTNHSQTPNVKCSIPEGCATNELVCHATRTIFPGEEITNDYRDFDASPDDVVEG